jgi:filamentous hemagglutinin family protein
MRQFILILMGEEKMKNTLKQNSIQCLLRATALTTIGIVLSGGAVSANNWVDHTAPNITVDTTVPNTTNITQSGNRAIVHGDGDIDAGWTVNLKQDNASSQYVLYDTEADPTHILGNLNANGQVFIFDQNGVIFGQDSRVNVGSIVASTGSISDADFADGDGRYTLNNVGTNGSIVLNGEVSVAEAGLAAFVAPTVINNGVINAKLGKVALAAGDKVTLDFYGDNLVEIAVDDKLGDALLENTGRITAEGGTIVVKAEAANDIVKNVINMDGFVSASSATVRGGKIILGGGSSGAVKVSGKLDASGTKAGTVDIRGEAINVASTADIKATGGNATVNIIADKALDYDGYILTDDHAAIELSGKELDVDGWIDIGDYSSILLDPAITTIDAALAALIEGFMSFNGSSVFVIAEDQIIIDSEINTLAQTSISSLTLQDQNADNNLQIDLNKKILLGANQTLNGEGTLVNVSADGLIQNGVDVAKSGATINVAAGTFGESVVVDKDVTLLGSNAGIVGDGVRGAASVLSSPVGNGFTVTSDNVTIDGFDINTPSANGVFIDHVGNVVIANNVIRTPALSGIRGSGADNVQIEGNLVQSPLTHFFGTIQGNDGSNWNIVNNTLDHGYYGIQLNDVAGTSNISDNTIGGMRVGGIHMQGLPNVTVSNNTITNSGNGIHVEGNAMGTTLISDNVMVRNKIGIYVDGANNVQILNNLVHRSYLDGIRTLDANGTVIDGNTIFWTGDKGIRLLNGGNVTVSNNSLDTIYGNAIHGVNVAGATIDNNTTTNVFSHFYGVIHAQGGSDWSVTNNNLDSGYYGINLTGVSGNSLIDGNTVHNMKVEGVHVEEVENVTISGNTVGNPGGSTTGNGIHVEGPNGSVFVVGNMLERNKIGIFVEGDDNVQISGNTINRSYLDGIRTLDANGTVIDGNTIFWTGDKGIRLLNGGNVTVSNNTLDTIFGNAIHGVNVAGATIDNNTTTNVFSHFYGVIHAQGGSDWLVSNNNLDGGYYGINLTNVAGSNSIFSNTVANMKIDGVHGEGLTDVTIANNIINNSKGQGIHLDGADIIHAVISGNTLNDNVFGMRIESGEIDLTGAANTINGGMVGILFDRYAGSAALSLVTSPSDIPGSSGTIGTTIFNGQTRSYIELANNAFSLGADNPLLIDATFGTYDGFNPDSLPRSGSGMPQMTPAQFNVLEDMLLHYPDLNTLGLFLFGEAVTPVTIAPTINQGDVFRFFEPTNSRLTTMNVTVLGLPNIPGVPNPAPGASPFNFNSITPFAGGEGSSPEDLNKIESAAGEEAPDQVASGITPQAGGNEGEAPCWGDAVGMAQGGVVANVDYTSSFEGIISDAASCQSGI